MIRTTQNNFTRGEISPALFGRTDLRGYFQAAARMSNFIPRKAGGARKRQGTDIVLDLSSYAAGRIIPFFYDRTSSTLILLCDQYARFIITRSDGSLGFSQSAGADYTVAVPWPNDVLPKIKAHQLGDTVYLSAPGYTAVKLVRYADDSWTLTSMTGITDVPTPESASFTVSPADFSQSGTVQTTANYALYAVKNGVLSAPRKKSATIYLPWNSGAKVSLSFTPNLASGVDGYILAKRVGAYYGKLAECYPTREALALLSSQIFSTSGVASTGVAASYKFSTDHVADLRAESPNAKTSQEIKMKISKFCIQIPKFKTALQTFAPNVLIDPTSSFALKTVRIFLGAAVASQDRQGYVTVKYDGAHSISGTIKRVGGTEQTFTISNDAATTGYADITVTDTTSSSADRNLKFTLNDALETGVIVRGIALYNTSGSLITTYSMTDANGLPNVTDFYAVGVSGRTDSSTNHLFTNLKVTSAADATDRDTLEEVSCSPKRYLSVHATPIALSVAADTGSYYATIRLTGSATFAVSEFRLYLGAEAAALPLNTPGSKARLAPNTVSCEIQYSTDGSTWATISTGGDGSGVFTLPSIYSDEPISISVPDDETTIAATASAKAWGLRIKSSANAPVVIRGCTLYVTNIEKRYTDINDVPTELIQSQTYLAPGSSDMDVDVIGMHQQRLVLAASNGLPFTLWFSKVGEIGMWYANRPMADDDPFQATIPATRSSRILHMLSDRRLLLFTEGGVYVVEGSESEGFSYRTARMIKVSNAGAMAGVEPIAGTDTVLFVAEDGRTLYELSYDLTRDGLVPINRSVLSEHLTEHSPIKRIAWQAAPDETVWVLLQDGTLLSFTYMPEHEVFAWARHTVAGVDTITDIIYTGSLADATDSSEATSELYLVATAGAKTYLLKMRPTSAADTPTCSRAACMDMAQGILVTADGEVSGYQLNELSTYWPTPYPYAPSAAPIAINMTDGTITQLTDSAGDGGAWTPFLAPGVYMVGFPVSAELDTLSPELPDRDIQGKRKNVLDTIVRTRRARSVTVSPYENTTATETSTSSAAIAEGLVPLTDGDFRVMPSGLCNRDARLRISSSDPWPCEILAVIASILIEGEGEREQREQ